MLHATCTNVMIDFTLGEPNNSGGEHCLHVYTSRNGWNDLPCNRAIAYVCEIHCMFFSEFKTQTYIIFLHSSCLFTN